MPDTFDRKVQFVADVITPPNGQPRTKARFYRYAREAVLAAAVFDKRADIEPDALTVALNRIQCREAFTDAQIDELAALPVVKSITVSHRARGGRVLASISFADGADRAPGLAPVYGPARNADPRTAAHWVP